MAEWKFMTGAQADDPILSIERVAAEPLTSRVVVHKTADELEQILLDGGSGERLGLVRLALEIVRLRDGTHDQR